MEIEFRVWDGKKMWYPETLTDDRNHTRLSFFNFSPSIGWGLYDAALENRVVSGGYPETKLMRYTGVNDMNGIKIWEGDIVQVGVKIMEVVFRDGCFYTPYSKSKYRLGGWEKLRIRVIGNIYQNKKLLKK